MRIRIIDYGSGNIKSIQFAFQRLGVEAVLSSDINEIKSADKIIFPGVGQASSAMEKLRETGLDILIPTLKQPVLGICLGMQLLCKSTEENNTQGLAIFDTVVKRFSNALKVPQIGWNTITNQQSALFDTIRDNELVYFIHSYYAKSCIQQTASSDYGIQYAAALQKDNFYGVQFHPEKSGKAGEQILKNFLNLTANY